MIRFADRELGFFELGERVAVVVEDGADAAHIELEDGFGRVCAKLPLTGGETEIPDVSVGYYRVFLCRASGERLAHDYFAFIVTVRESDRYCGETSFATDVAAEYEPTAMARAEELLRAVRLQGFKLTRSRSYTGKWSDEVTSFRKCVSESGLEVIGVHMDGYGDMPKIAQTDLFDVYETFRKAPTDNPFADEIYELQNEPDLMTSAPALPDSLAAHNKAALIGLADADADVSGAMAGIALGRDCLYADIYMQNGILDYSPVYNFHGYDQIYSLLTYARKVSLAYAPKGSPAVSYMTENGKKVWAGEDGVAFPDHLKEMNRYAVTSSVQVLSQGTDKWFWFISRAFLEHGGGFGSMHAWTYQPYPVAAVLSNLTYQLGRGEYLGIMSSLPERTSGYVFNNGTGSHVAVVFASKDEKISVFADEITVADMFGTEYTLTSADGSIGVDVGKDPIFIRFKGACDVRNYYPSAFCARTLPRRKLTEAQRVVVNAIWEDQDLSSSLIMQKGYTVSEGKKETVLVRVYNFNPVPVEGDARVYLEYPDHFEIEPFEAHVAAEPFGCAETRVTLRPNAGKKNSSGDVKFGVDLKGMGEGSGAVARYWFISEGVKVDEADIRPVAGLCDLKRWNFSNIAYPGVISAETDGEGKELTMKISHGGAYAQWFFPLFCVEDPSVFDGTDGLVVRKKNSFETKGKDKLSTYVLTHDGRAYWSGAASAAPTSTEWQTAIYPWETFGLYSSPEGLNDIRDLKTSDIAKIRVGVSGTSPDVMPDITIDRIGGYFGRIKSTRPHPQKIRFEGVENNAHYESCKELELLATLPVGGLEDVRVYYGKREFDAWERDGDTVRLDISSLGRGEHVFQVSAKNNVNYRYISFITFYSEE